MPRLWSARSWMSAIALVSFTIASPGLMAAQVPLMPLPAHLTQETGQFPIDGGFRVVFEGYTEPRLERAVDRFRTNLTRKTGILHFPESSPAQPVFTIRTTASSASVQQLGEDESYHLEWSHRASHLRRPIRSASCTVCRHFCNW